MSCGFSIFHGHENDLNVFHGNLMAMKTVVFCDSIFLMAMKMALGDLMEI